MLLSGPVPKNQKVEWRKSKGESRKAKVESRKAEKPKRRKSKSIRGSPRDARCGTGPRLAPGATTLGLA